MSEIKDLHNPFKDFLKSKGITKYIYKNWNNKNRQGDEGRPDFVIPINEGITLWIEFKSEDKYKVQFHGLEPKQFEWQQYLIRNNHSYLVTDSLEKAINFVNLWIGDK